MAVEVIIIPRNGTIFRQPFETLIYETTRKYRDYSGGVAIDNKRVCAYSMKAPSAILSVQ